MKHSFTETIFQILESFFGAPAEEVFEQSQLLQYINFKTRSANRGSKARGSFANLYAIYVLLEDYITRGFHKRGNYANYEGAMFGQLFKRQRELSFGSKLQNHALNHRLNEEFRKFFPQSEILPILRDVERNRYWINENLLKIKVDRKTRNIAPAVIAIIEAYITTKRSAFESFIETCEQLKNVSAGSEKDVEKFITDLLAPNIDARLFEIVSFAILKYYYHDQVVYFGFARNRIEALPLSLYKTGRTNANDGGIDFVMKPLGRFFQVTETLDVRKYFLDIDKLEKYPLSFVIKSEEEISALQNKLEANARKQYPVDAISKKYLSCVEEIIKVPTLKERLQEAKQQGYLSKILDEIIRQSRVEFNYEE
ncbi:MAG: restriction endonuclease [Acidobacteria bacterium]|nr:restriction endonuclease [Acidobacteriota bacterium]